MNKLKIILLSFFFIAPSLALAGASLPMSFYGRAELDGVALPAGSKVQVFANGVLEGEALVDSNGYYGESELFKTKLVVAEYSGNALIFKYILNGAGATAAGNTAVIFEGNFEAGKTVSFDLPFIKNIQITVAPGTANTNSGETANSEKTPTIPAVATTTPEIQQPQVLGVKIENHDIYRQVVARETSLLTAVDQDFVKKLSGYILLQVENNGEAWYVDLASQKKYFLQNGAVAYQALRTFGLGITNADLNKIPDANNPSGTGYDKKLVNRLKGRILLQTQSKGEAWYVNPKDGKRYYLKDGDAAYSIMRSLSLGITNVNLRKIEVGDISF
jgi:hypothetical protein